MSIESLFPLVKACVLQITGIFGVFFLFGYILSRMQRTIQSLYLRAIGWHGILWTAWIGTPIHELGHIFFAKLFGHTIHSVSLFRPNKQTGGLGHVEHSYTKWNIYSRAGNFFVGAAPMIFGSVVLYLMFRFLLPGGTAVLAPLKSNALSLEPILLGIEQALRNLFELSRFQDPLYILFLYMSFAIATHIAPSPADQKQMWSGFAMLVGIIIVLNLAAFIAGVEVTSYVLSVTQYLGILMTMFSYVFVLLGIHLILSFLLLRPIIALRKR
jgi:hypothetical protein